MATPNKSVREQDYVTKAMDITVRLLLVGLVLIACLKILNPFITPVVWGALIAVALYTPYLKMRSWLGGKNKLAGVVFILVTIGLMIVPTVWLADSVMDGARGLTGQLKQGTLHVPPPTESVKDWPVIGHSAYTTWSSAAQDLAATLQKMEPQLKAAGAKAAAAAGGLTVSFIQTLFALLIAGLFLMNADGATQTMKSIGRRMGGDRGEGMIGLATGTIRSVVKGVLLVALIQSLLSAVGLVIAHVPAAGLFALLVLVVAVIQLPPILILGPIAIWVFSSDTSTGVAVFFLIWSIIVSASDGFLKPLFLGRGVNVPMVVILIGAIGGMMAMGVVGLFVGAVVLGMGYELFMAYVKGDAEDAPAPAPAGETAK